MVKQIAIRTIEENATDCSCEKGLRNVHTGYEEFLLDKTWVSSAAKVAGKERSQLEELGYTFPRATVMKP